ncbi:unnamed protein product [Brassica rapa]|uniref:Uncharacterized protein n=1 Tax=Brassica campestris TaxID=3711 RepID=A0A3P5XX60_BRACM|nr:unnamed protein product [Brassica rapa]VDC59602.1 unnamed protein product [Brassica rapa]
MAKKMGVTMEVGNDGVAVITISNPPVNSLASPIIYGLKEKFQDANHRSDVKAIVLTENGERFSGGFNINVFQQVHKTGTQAALLVLTKTTQFISSSPCFGLVPSLPSLTSINCQRRRQDKTAQPRVIPLQADGIQRVSEAVALVDRMVETKVRPDLITLTTLVNGLCLKGYVSEAMSLIDRMVEHGFRPDGVTYGTVLNRLCK